MAFSLHVRECDRDLHVGQTQHTTESAAEADTPALAQIVTTEQEAIPAPLADAVGELVTDTVKEPTYLKEILKENVPNMLQESIIHNRKETNQEHLKQNTNVKKEVAPDVFQTTSDMVEELNEPISLSKPKEGPNHEAALLPLSTTEGRASTPRRPLPVSDGPVLATKPNLSSKSHKQQQGTATRAQGSGQGYGQPSSSRPIPTRSQIHTPTQSVVQHKSHQTGHSNLSSRAKEDKMHIPHKPSRQ